jgi:hypothetical protein
VTGSRSVWKSFAAVTALDIGWLVTAPFLARGAEPTVRPAGIDPARAAREVFQDESFWWKRVEAPTMPQIPWFSWLQSIFAAWWDSVGAWLADIAKAIARFLARLFGMFGGTAPDATTAVLLIVVGLLAWSVWKFYPVVARWLTAGRPPRITFDGSGWQPLAEAADLFEQAGQAFRDGRHAEAIRLALLALIARLEKQGLLRYDTTRTNREYQKELRHMSELAASFGQLARIYDRVWYGRVSASRGDAEQAISLCESLINREGLAPE